MTSLGPVYLPAPLSNVKRAAIAFTRNEVEGRICSHAAILYRPIDSGPLKRLDLHPDGDVHCKEVRPDKPMKYSWSLLAIPDDLQTSLAWFCEEVASRAETLGYWFEYGVDETLIDDGTTIQLSGRSIGLTCSTFVLAVLAAQSIDLLALDTWHNADDARKAEDREYQKWLLDYLKRNVPKFRLSPDIASREGNIPCIRYSPEDVIGATRVPQLPDRFQPVPFSVAAPIGEDVRRWTDDALGFAANPLS